MNLILPRTTAACTDHSTRSSADWLRQAPFTERSNGRPVGGNQVAVFRTRTWVADDGVAADRGVGHVPPDVVDDVSVPLMRVAPPAGQVPVRGYR